MGYPLSGTVGLVFSGRIRRVYVCEGNCHFHHRVFNHRPNHNSFNRVLSVATYIMLLVIFLIIRSATLFQQLWKG